MSDQSKMFQVMLLAASLVMASGAVFYIGGENEVPEPGLPESTDMMLTYEVEGVLDGGPVNGSLNVKVSTNENGQLVSYSWPYDITGNLGPLATMPGSMFRSGCFLVRSSMDTPWGEKQGLLFIGQGCPWNEVQGLVFAYRGASTDLVYRMDLVAPEAKATYSLANVNITGMEGLDLKVGENIGDLTAIRHVPDGYTDYLGGGESWGLLEARGDESYRVSLNVTEYAFMVFGEQEILSMAMGGDFAHVEEWSIIGNGTIEFVVTDQIVFYYLYPIVDLPGPDGVIEITVV